VEGIREGIDYLQLTAKGTFSPGQGLGQVLGERGVKRADQGDQQDGSQQDGSQQDLGFHAPEINKKAVDLKGQKKNYLRHNHLNRNCHEKNNHPFVSRCDVLRRSVRPG
jgi:hypothetical protein